MSPATIDAAGGGGQITISVNRDCTWEARSETEWIALVAPTSGQGEANLGYTALPNAVVSDRRGAVVVNDQRVEIAQAAAACRFDLSARGASVAAAGERIAVSVTAQASCVWTAVSQVDWVRIDAGREGDGSGAVTISVAPNTGAAREGTVLVAGQGYSVSQAAAPPPGPPSPPPPPTPPPPTPPPPTPPPPTPPGCEFTVSPSAESFAPSGGDGTVRVVAPASNCAWAAVSNVPWISMGTSGGTGTGDARYMVVPNAGAARTGTLTVARTTVTVTQAAAPTPPACEFTVSPLSESFAPNGGDGTVRIRASESTCAWAAVSNVPWISMATSGGSGTGDARYVVAPNASAARSGTLTVAGATVTVTQAAVPLPPACEFTVSPLSESFSAAGGDGTVRVEASAQTCAWTAVSNVPWISMATSGGSGTGDARYVVAPNASAARSGTLTVAGATVTVMQAAVLPPGPIVLSGEISGLSGQCPNLTFTLQSSVVQTNASTVFEDRCDRVRNRRDYTVSGVVQLDGSVLALRVRERDD